ncbi:MAG: AAA family ATPase [Bacteroidales bacterium]
MPELLWKYMEERLQEKGYLPVTQRHGPVVTISREYGCQANLIAEELIKKIRQRYSKPENQWWRIINKEIVTLAARELEISSERVESVFKAEQKRLFDEILEALSTKYYKNDTTIRKTIMRVIRAIIDDGYVVMVGRGGVAFSKDKENAINIQLQAPLEQRIKVIRQKFNLNPKEAMAMIDHTDKERSLLIEHFFGKTIDSTIYDLIINTGTINIHQVAEIIFHLMEEKRMI